MRYLLDTDSLSYFFRGEGQVLQHLQLLAPADVAIPSPVLYESRFGMLRLAQGARQSALLAALDRAIAIMDVIPFDRDAGEAAARVRHGLEAGGEKIGSIDVQIAGIALAQAATLVTRNVREFARIPNLKIENWYDG